MPKLTIVFDDAQEIVVPLADLLTVGSAEDNDVVVDDARLSAHHAEIALRADGSVKVYDLGSATGTFVNGQRVTKQTLAEGDKLAFGPLQAVLDLEIGTQATAVPLPVPESKTKTSAGTRRIPLPPATPPPEPQAIPSADLHAAENRLALLEAAAKQAEASQRDWMAAVERLKTEHAEKTTVMTQLGRDLESKSATLLQLQTSITTAQASLESAIARERDSESKQRQLQDSQREAQAKLAELKRLTQDAEAQAREAAAAQLLQESVASVQSRLDAVSAREREETQRLEQLRQTLSSEEARLTEMRRQISEGETRAREAAAIAPLLESLASVQSRLAASNTQEQEQTQRLAELRRQISEASELETKHRSEVEAAVTQLAALKVQIEGFAQAEEKLATLREALAEAEKQQTKHSTAIAGLQQERQFQEKALTEVETRLSEVQSSLASTKDELTSETRRLAEVRARREELQAANAAPMEELHRRLERARHDLGVIEARLRPLRDWKEAQERRLAQLSMLPPGSPEAKEVLREIDSEAADLLHIVNIPPSRTPRIVQVEAPYFKGVAMKSEHTRVSPPAV